MHESKSQLQAVHRPTMNRYGVRYTTSCTLSSNPHCFRFFPRLPRPVWMEGAMEVKKSALEMKWVEVVDLNLWASVVDVPWHAVCVWFSHQTNSTANSVGGARPNYIVIESSCIQAYSNSISHNDLAKYARMCCSAERLWGPLTLMPPQMGRSSTPSRALTALPSTQQQEGLFLCKL